MKTTHSIPATVAYAASEAPAFPDEAIVTTFAPTSLARAMTTAAIRSLYEPVGLRVSFLRYRLSSPTSAPSAPAWISGVSPSPSQIACDRLAGSSAW